MKGWERFIIYPVLILILFLGFQFTRSDCLAIKNNDFLVSVLSVLVTILIGWNILQIIDIKSYKKQIKRELGKVKKRYDFVVGLDNLLQSQNLACLLNEDSRHKTVYIMLCQYLFGCSKLAKIGRYDMCESVIDILLESLAQEGIRNITFTKDELAELNGLYYRVNNKDKIQSLYKIYEYINR